uniref:Leucine Rich repeat-containing domain protein n=1 Tax=Ditylenchus dipsaci TaxID=166011 RepID=A0A915E9F4_9BILA
MFEGFDQMRELRITNCQLRQLTDATFAGLPKLRALHLTQFSSSSPNFPPKLFRQINSLEKLTLADSAIENIPQGVLCSLRFLQILNVSSNKISNARLGVDTSDCILDHLIILDLGKNRLRHISSADFNPFPSLRQLSLSKNGLRGMELEAFRAINLIQRLDLDHNHLREVAPLPESLYHLNLAHNNLAVIPPPLQI